ncbi:MAG TPA: hypothetical protein VMU26_16805 [Candidatus Polarisedimenticolia bacterium]|nr:hypothetical protein [Candidatus Polarisedimenticolia bacterium]
MLKSQMDSALIPRRDLSLAKSMKEIAHLPRFLVCLALVLLMATYWPVLRYGFVFDDTQQIVQNPVLRSWSYVLQYFTANLWESIYPEVGGDYYLM